MSRQRSVSVGAIALLVGAVWLATPRDRAAAQTPEGDEYRVPRTPDGQPDLQGIWTNDTLTPFERPTALGNRAFLSEEEAEEIEKRAVERAARANENRPASTAPPPKGASVGGYNYFWLEEVTSVVGTRRTSLVIDPPDGRVPLRPEAAAQRRYDLDHKADDFKHMSVYTRCITRGVPGTMFPALYNNGYQILQTPDTFVILYEMVRHARIIPLDGRPRISQNIGLWMGDARGHWEGDTLVVETKNFNDKGWIASNVGAARIQGIHVSEDLSMVERFTRIDDHTIDYRVTIEDPQAYTAPWTVAVPLERDADYEIYEYACHEGNRALEIILGGGRAQEREARID